MEIYSKILKMIKYSKLINIIQKIIQEIYHIKYQLNQNFLIKQILVLKFKI